jgi:hypothetical protein
LDAIVWARGLAFSVVDWVFRRHKAGFFGPFFGFIDDAIRTFSMI